VGSGAGNMQDRILPPALRDYALLADGERGAVVGPRGEIVWMCAPRWDSDAVFAALVGGEAAYTVTPRSRFVWGGYYEQSSLIWRSRWITDEGIIECREALAFPGDPHRAVLLRSIIASATMSGPCRTPRAPSCSAVSCWRWPCTSRAPRTRAVARVLGVRHLIQAAVTAAVPNAAVLTIGAQVDLAHAASMLALAATSRPLRRAGLADGLTAAVFAAGGMAGARTPRHVSAATPRTPRHQAAVRWFTRGEGACAGGRWFRPRQSAARRGRTPG
jgi:Domain of unknown function (DUF5911)